MALGQDKGFLAAGLFQKRELFKEETAPQSLKFNKN